MRRPATLTAAAAALVLAFTGCSPSPAPEQPATSSGIESDAELLSAYGLAGRTVEEVIDHLDQMPVAERPSDLTASVRTDMLILGAPEHELTMPMPDDAVYVSVAPYVSQTHDCFFHSLTTCRGEMSGEDVQVRVIAQSGEVLIDEQRTSFDNGFIGLWLPRDVAGTIEIDGDGRTGSVPFSTADDGATCVTTLQLS